MFKAQQNEKRFPSLAMLSGMIFFASLTWASRVPAEPTMTDTTLAPCEHQKHSATFEESMLGNLSPEPNDEFLVNEDINIITGLYTREYALQGNGVVDYRTARQIVLSEYNEYWNSVVHTMEFPLFYWVDGDHDGQFDMWVDQKVDGMVCDIVPYQVKDNNPDEPRGLF